MAADRGLGSHPSMLMAQCSRCPHTSIIHEGQHHVPRVAQELPPFHFTAPVFLLAEKELQLVQQLLLRQIQAGQVRY